MTDDYGKPAGLARCDTAAPLQRCFPHTDSAFGQPETSPNVTLR